MIGLGRRVGTPAQGITAPVIVVASFGDLTKRAGEAKGKIVLFDLPFTSYGETVRYRGGAASAAARVGAVAALIRSVSSYSIQNPHTGAMSYDTAGKAKIPATALSVEDALMLHRMINRGDRVVVNLKMSAGLAMAQDIATLLTSIGHRGQARPARDGGECGIPCSDSFCCSGYAWIHPEIGAAAGALKAVQRAVQRFHRCVLISRQPLHPVST